MSVTAPPKPGEQPPAVDPKAAGSKTTREVIAKVSANPPPSGVGARRKVAVVVAHGMGQQVPFETVEGVAYAIRDAQQRAAGVAPTVYTRFIKIGDLLLPSAAIALVGPRDADAVGASTTTEVDLFEAYWAPLTEGKITARDTFAFLFAAGVRGAVHSGLRNKFERLIFNGWYEFKLGRQIWAQFLAAVLTIASLALINVTMLSVVVPSLLAGLRASWIPSSLLSNLTIDLTALLLVLTPCLVLGVALPAIRRHRDSAGYYPTPAPVWRWGAWSLVWLALLATIAAGVVVLLQLLASVNGSPWLSWSARIVDLYMSSHGGGSIWPLAILWGLVLILSSFVRRFLVQYVGDVAIYVSSNSVNRFSQTRDEIQKVTYDVLRAVYGRRENDALIYDQVVLVGHSLGSVVAYDELNRMLMDDVFAGAGLEAARRTALLLTFGSPLDKVAYIFRSQRPVDCSIRESLAEARQPMLTAYSSRPRRWVNLHSPNDWIGASLDFFDGECAAADREKRIVNIVDPEATTPLLAHSEHWSGYLFSEVLYRGIMANLPDTQGLMDLWKDRPVGTRVVTVR